MNIINYNYHLLLIDFVIVMNYVVVLVASNISLLLAFFVISTAGKVFNYYNEV